MELKGNNTSLGFSDTKKYSLDFRSPATARGVVAVAALEAVAAGRGLPPATGNGAPPMTPVRLARSPAGRRLCTFSCHPTPVNRIALADTFYFGR